MDKQSIINQTVLFVKETLSNAEGGHDWWHIYRVWNNAKLINKSEKANSFIVELGALLHDIADSKFNNGNEEIGPEKAKSFLQSIQVDSAIINEILEIIKNISFKGGNFNTTYKSLELDVVQDADRLDAIGAIGIARTFNYGGFKNREMYNPNIPPVLNMSKEEYKNSNAPTINHFYEKLLLLKDRMNTKTGKKLSEKRHLLMISFLEEFYSESFSTPSWHS